MAKWEMEGGGEENVREDKEGGRETRHTGLVQSRLWRLGVGLVSMGPREQTDSGREKRKQRSILSELGSYPRGHRIGLAHGESQRRRGVGRVAIYIILFWTKEDICEHKRELFERLCMWKYRTGPFELINQSIKGCCL